MSPNRSKEGDPGDPGAHQEDQGEKSALRKKEKLWDQHATSRVLESHVHPTTGRIGAPTLWNRISDGKKKKCLPR